jgi:hypothetical protein
MSALMDVKTTCVGAIVRSLNLGLAQFRKRVIEPSAAEFASSIPESHRKGESAWHVKGFNGSKDGKLTYGLLQGC